MVMKDGTVVPKPLADALANDTQALKIFMEMSQVNQQLCVEQMRRKGEGSMRMRIEKAIEGIHKHGKARSRS